MTTLYLVGDVFDRLAELRRRRVRVALVLCSPPFLALRSYLPDGHPLKAQEIGSEATPAAFVDVMLALVAACAHVLAPWGSVALELGDTYAGSGGAGGDYDEDGLRAGQPKFHQTRANSNPLDPNKAKDRSTGRWGQRIDTGGGGWPMAKSLAGIPEAVMLSLAYGYNVLDRRGPDSPAGRWMIRNFKPWIRSNPPVGALGDKERPATSYVIVATRDPQRYFDLDAVRTQLTEPGADARFARKNNGREDARVSAGLSSGAGFSGQNVAGPPPRDWCHSVDMVLDAELNRRRGKPTANRRNAIGVTARPNTHKSGDDARTGGNRSTLAISDPDEVTTGAQGVHLRRALERAGILTTLDAIDVSPKGYRGAHYAVWPPDLVRLLVDEMCPRRVCSVCGQPSRRIVGEASYIAQNGGQVERNEWGSGIAEGKAAHSHKPDGGVTAHGPTLGWSGCGCPGDDRWQPGTVLDPFAGSGTTLAVCSGMGRTSIGIDLDYTNVELALERVGMWLDVEWPDPDWELLERRALGAGSPHPAHYDRWCHQLDSVQAELVGWLLACAVAALAAAVGAPFEGDTMPAVIPRAGGRKVPAMVGQGTMFDHQA